MREIIISILKDSGWLDPAFRVLSIDREKNYEEWLRSLSDGDLLDAYFRVRTEEEKQ